MLILVFEVIVQHTVGQKIKKIQAKKLVKSNKSISHKKSFYQIPYFAISKMAKNQFLNWGKSLKLPKVQFHEKKIFGLFDFMSFFAWTLLNFLARGVKYHNCAISRNFFLNIFYEN